MCKNPFDITTCPSDYAFYTQPWVLLAFTVFLLLFGALPWGIYTYILRERVKELSAYLQKADTLERELKQQMDMSARARRRHLENVTKPALDRLFISVRVTKKGIQVDQALDFLTSLNALAADDLLLKEIQSAVIRENNEDEEEAHYIKFWWETTTTGKVFFVQWPALKTAFSLTVTLL